MCSLVGASFVANLLSSRARCSGLKPLLQKPSLCRSGFSRDPLRHREPEVGSWLFPSNDRGLGCRSAARSSPARIGGPRRGENDRCGKRGFPRDLRPPRRQKGSKPEPSRWQAEIHFDILVFVVGADFAATFAPSKTGGPELSRRLPSRPSHHRRRVFGAEAPPTEIIFL